MSREEQKEQARRRILAAASRQLREEGLTGPSVVRVMQEAGLTHGGFYIHFESKDELLAEAEGNAMKDGRKRLFSGSRRTPGPERRRRLLARYLSPAHRDAPGTGCPLPATSAEVARASDSVRRVYDDELRQIIASFEAELRDLQTNDTHQRAVGTLALCVGSLLLARAALDSALSEDILNACRQFAAAAEETKRHEH